MDKVWVAIALDADLAAMDPRGRRVLLAEEVDRGERPTRTVLGTGVTLPADARLEDVLGMGQR